LRSYSPVVVAFVLTLAAAPVIADATAPVEALRERVDAIRDVAGAQISGQAVFSTHILPDLYERHGFAPLWSTAAATSLVEQLQAADADGLDPRDYHLDAIERLRAGAPGAASAVDLDLLESDAFLAYLYHLREGKVDPVSLDPQWNYGSELAVDDATLARLDTAIAAGDIGRAVDEVRPRYPIYADLRAALAAYRTLAQAGGWPAVPDGATLKAGMTDSRVRTLRARLAVTETAATNVAQPELFDDDLVEVVRRFQRRHSLTADGAVGPATLRELNVPIATRIDQLRINLERVRWIPETAASEYVLVDVAGFRVSLIRDDAVAWRTRAVVGRPYRSTPIFGSNITYVVVNPAWTVPPGILAKDTLPAIRRDPAYLEKNRMDVVDRNGRIVDPAGIEWSRYTAANFPYTIRQRPGPQNSLGLVKIMFPNEHLVYLHDTPARTLFARDERAFSSGCIRIERPFDLVELLLDDPTTWNHAALDAVVATGQTRTITLQRPVPVVILYWTAEVDELGRIVFKPDIYHRDAKLLAALDSAFAWGHRTIRREAAGGAGAR
jgi:L,D-transpeptidase YcbB